MLGRTHVTTTTATGSAAIYGLYLATQSETLWLKDLSIAITDRLGLPFDQLTFWPFTLWMSFCILALGLGALLPDIDSKSSILGRYVPWVQDTVGHRTITHTIWIVALLFGLAFWLEFTVVWMIAIGYTLHIVQDSFSVQGINWFWPLGKGFHVRLYRVGGLFEDIIYGLSMGAHVWLLYTWMKLVGVGFLQ